MIMEQNETEMTAERKDFRRGCASALTLVVASPGRKKLSFRLNIFTQKLLLTRFLINAQHEVIVLVRCRVPGRLRRLRKSRDTRMRHQVQERVCYGQHKSARVSTEFAE